MSGGEHWQRGDEELLRAFADCEERLRREYAASLALIAELVARDVAGSVGYSGLALLLRDVARISTADARRRISQAAAVSATPLVSGGVVPAALPVTATALRDGVLGGDHVEQVVRVVQGLPLHVPDADRELAERVMVEAALTVDPQILAKLGRQVRDRLDQDGTPPDDRELAEPVNELHLTTRRNGRLTLRGEFEPEASALITAVLSPLAKPRPADDTGPDPRSAAERHGDALVEVFQLTADSGTLPSEAGEKPHLLVTVPLEALRIRAGSGDRGIPGTTSDPADDGDRGSGRTGTGRPPEPPQFGRPILDGIGSIDAESARRIACDARIIPVVLGSRSEPLDLGRSSYTISTALRRALILRDGGCAFPGCDRSHRHCHGHHIQHWADGGPTELDNLVLLCGRHHRLIHHSSWECAVENGRPEFRPPRFVDATRTPRRNLLHTIPRTGPDHYLRKAS